MSSFKQESRLAPLRYVTALGLSLFAAGALAQPTAEVPLTVTGTLVDERGAPAAGAEVVLIDENAAPGGALLHGRFDAGGLRAAQARAELVGAVDEGLRGLGGDRCHAVTGSGASQV